MAINASLVAREAEGHDNRWETDPAGTADSGRVCERNADAAVVYGGLCVFEQVARISGAVNTERWIKPLTLSSVCSLELSILPFHSDTYLKR